jgi:hypothetical protein
MGLFSKFTGSGKIARELGRSDPMAPAAPMVPESVAGIHQVEKVGGLQWQMRQLPEAEERLDAKAARMGARARQNVMRSIAAGEGQFGVDAHGQCRTTEDGEFQEMRANLVTDYSEAERERDRKLLELPGGLAPEMRAYRKRGDVKAAAPELASPEEVQDRIRQLDAPRPTQVHIPGFVIELAGSQRQADEVIAEYLTRAGANLEAPGKRVIYRDPGDCDLTVTWIPEGFDGNVQNQADQGQEGSDAQGPGPQT